MLASDDGDPMLTTSATITVQVQDINEFSPQFSSANYTRTTLNVSIGNTSNTRSVLISTKTYCIHVHYACVALLIFIIIIILIDTVLVTVSATDADGRDNSITYSFAPDSDTSLFTINEKTGQISLSSSFPALGPNQAVSVPLL